MMSISEILEMDDEDDQFEAMETLHEELTDGVPVPLDESDLRAIFRYLQMPKFPDNLAMAWTVAIATQTCRQICTFAADCIQDTTCRCRDLAAQYLRFHCSVEFSRCLDGTHA